MGLNHPVDLAAWEEWERNTHRLRTVKATVLKKVRPSQPQPFVLSHPIGGEPTVVAALDVSRGTSLDALVEPVLKLGQQGAIVTCGPLSPRLVPAGWTTQTMTSLDELPASITTVLSAGSIRAVSLPMHTWAEHRGARFVVVQHGLLTPFAPPLPSNVHVLAWNEAEGEFWRSGRDDVTVESVGSQLLWKASQQQVPTHADVPPIWLGQLHGAELSRASHIQAAEAFCFEYGALYRAHPAERGIKERTQHALWRRRGMQFDTSERQLAELGHSVASVFSSGILEAAAQGLPAWGFHPDPPRWVEEFWERNAIARWGQEPTQVALPEEEPAAVIARLMG